MVCNFLLFVAHTSKYSNDTIMDVLFGIANKITQTPSNIKVSIRSYFFAHHHSRRFRKFVFNQIKYELCIIWLVYFLCIIECKRVNRSKCGSNMKVHQACWAYFSNKLCMEITLLGKASAFE